MSQKNNSTNTENSSISAADYSYTGENNNIPITITNTFVINYNKKVLKTEFIENEEGNFIEVISSIVSNSPFVTSNLVKERYGILNGKLQLVKTIHGNETPGYYVEPQMNWDE